ncbi:MAG: hypothetical protein HDR88_07825 [Bacteroides sp.]|nr:hypothetical protein [Bacteroides sp.]
MRDHKYIQVLWVENDPRIIASFPNEADMMAGIELYPFPCWEEAEIELENNYDRWDAIILDAKCRYRKDDADMADKFLSHVFVKIMDLASRKNRTIPWYVLSGQGEDDIRNLIPDTNEWDKDWIRLVNRPFYSKNGKVTIKDTKKHERHILFDRIKNHVKCYRHELQIEYDLYPDVFKALDNLDLASEVGYYLMPLLEPIHFSVISNEDYNRRYVDLRKALENIFRHMVDMGILPTILINKGNKDDVNLSWSSLFLGQEIPDNIEILTDSEKKFWDKVNRITGKPLLPKQLSQWLKAAIFQTGGAVHTSSADEELTTNLDKYLPLVGKSPYMLRCLTMGLCDFILWYNNFIREHPDKEKNLKDFWMLKENKNSSDNPKRKR